MKRYFLVTLTLWLVLTLAIWNLIKAWTFLTWQNVLLEFSVGLAPQVGLVISIIWVASGFVLAWGIWQKKVWSVKILPALATGYTIWFWSERFIWQNAQTNFIFTVMLNLIILIIIYFATKLLSREAYERTIENPEIE
jgi:hypothetical protein